MFKNNPQRFFAMASEGRGGGDANDLPEIKVEEHAEREPSSRWRDCFRITLGNQNFLIDNCKEYDDRKGHNYTRFEIYESQLRKELAALSFTDDQKKRLYGAVLGAVQTFMSTDSELLRRSQNRWKLTIQGINGKRTYETTSEGRLSHHTLQ